MTIQEAKKILSVESNYSRREITLRFRILARKFHPDKWTPESKYSKDVCMEKFKRIANARDLLMEKLRTI